MPPKIWTLVERLEELAKIGDIHARDKNLRDVFACRLALMVQCSSSLRGTGAMLTFLAARRGPFSLVREREPGIWLLARLGRVF
jgi:hypothetical protein